MKEALDALHLEKEKIFVTQIAEETSHTVKEGASQAKTAVVSEEEKNLKKIILTESGEKVLKFISEQVPLHKDRTILLSSSSDITYEISSSNSWQIRTIIDLGIINYKHDLSTYFNLVNSTLPDSGVYIGCIESTTERKKRFLNKYPVFVVNVLWFFDFIINRVFSKISLTKSLYSFISKNKYYVISKAEVLGRLSHAGFEIIGHEEANGLLYFSVIKTSEPKHEQRVDRGILLKMNRISKNGKIIGVYKIRTMHPYSQYIQEYVVRMNGYNDVGKPNYDFRITNWSKLLRKLHVDELPQLLNVLKGELNIIGVRPLTKFGFESLPLDLQQKRIKYKPGCIPPNVSLGLKGFEGVIRAERIYLRSRERYGIWINFKYFWMAIYNMVVKRNMSA
jgi:lipopolysaccharide/colanic/teichoic acid biosynthesis glycosyltransferase